MNTNNIMTVVFIGFDGYSDLWDDCIGLYKKFWPDCPYRTLFINNVKDVSYAGIDVFHAGMDAEWSRKVQLAIQEIKTPYICLLIEDFFIGDKVDTNTVIKTLEYIQQEQIRYFKLVNMNRAVKNHDPNYKGLRYLHVIPESDEYGVSLQAAIWDKEYLSKLVGTENYNAWTFEFDRVRESKDKPDTPNPGCIFDDRNILNLQHGVIQSKYLPGTINYFKKKGIELNVQREVMSYSQYNRIRFGSKVKYTLPKPLRGKVKHFLENCGMKFVSTVRDK